MHHHKTPSVAVLDSRGLTVRNIAYHRHPDTPDVTRERITRHRYSARGVLTCSADPRLHAAGRANFTYLTDLAGSILRAQGADNGTSLALNDAAGRPFLTVADIRTAEDGTQDRARALTRTWQYEDAALPGRPVSVTEQTAGDAARITERFVYAGHSEAEKARNLAGVCVSHYDSAGLMQTDSLALTGVPRAVTRRLLQDADNPDCVADWQGHDATAWQALLTAQSGAYTTLATADATGAVLTTTDAAGNRQRVACDVAGLLAGSWLTTSGGAEQAVVKALTWSAAGQKLREAHGNGVVTTYTYEAQTQRLTGMKTERPAGHAGGAKVLQDLRYAYDPAGNVLSVRDAAEAPCFWRNQKVVAQNTYGYDSLYQLVSATGREMAGAGQPGSLPAATVPLPADNSAYTHYTRSYTYDDAGNLTQIRHSAPATGNRYTTDITVSHCSNRGVLRTLTENPAAVDALFTAGGQQTQLQPGQALCWTARHELLSVMPVVREGAADDRESYRYDADSQRILKVSVQKTGRSTRTQRVLYLPGLALHTSDAGGTQTENLQVVTAGEAGRAQVRVLHWTHGRPEAVCNNAMRYSYDNNIGSSGLELDGDGNILSMEEYYPYGGTAVWTARSAVEAQYKTVRYSGKERDATGLYYYGHRYYQPWVGRWLSADPAGTVDGLNLFRMCRNNPVTLYDDDGLNPSRDKLSNGLYVPKIKTGEERDQSGASSIKFSPMKSDDFTGVPVTLEKALTEDALETTPLLTDLINPAKVAMSEATKNALSNNSLTGGILAFNAIRFTKGETSIHALRIVDEETSNYQYGGAVSLAYWAPQGGYVDIPAHPQPQKNEPNIVLTPAFSGCSLVVDKIDENTLRVRHVQGGKEDSEYNNLTDPEHGMGMVNAMEYGDYGFHENDKGGFIENITGSAFMIYENNQWKIKFQRLAHPPGISSPKERERAGWLGSYTELKSHIRYNSNGKSVVNKQVISLRH